MEKLKNLIKRIKEDRAVRVSGLMLLAMLGILGTASCWNWAHASKEGLFWLVGVANLAVYGLVIRAAAKGGRKRPEKEG